MAKKAKNQSGRKLFDGKSEKIVVPKLEHAFSLGATDKEACVYAGISTTALYRYEQKNEQFRERKRMCKAKTILKARQEVVRGLEGNPEFSLKYLERKMPQEFSPNRKFYVCSKCQREGSK